MRSIPPPDRCLTRRTLLAAAGAAVAGCAAPPMLRVAPASVDGPAAVALANRLTWGADPASVQALRAQGLDAWVQGQVRPAAAVLPDPAASAIAAMTITQRPLDALWADMDRMRRDADAKTIEDERKDARAAYQRELTRLAREASARHLLRAVHSPNQLHEQMTWFWGNHFSVQAGKRELRLLVGDYEETALRPHALGRFRDLLGAVVRHPAMLRYLDNDQNAANRINENFARELMELHTLGVDGGYSQADVQELARLLTGVGVAPPDGRVPPVRRELQADYRRTGSFEFHPNRHDYGAKQLLGAPVLARGPAELDEALDRLARHPATARHITRKLALWWMQDEPPPALLDALAATFRRTDGDMAVVLQGLLLDPRFAAARKFKDPMRYLVSAVRLACDGRVVINANPMLFWLNRLGEPLYGRPTPDGYPLDARAWDSAGQMADRFEFARAFGGGAEALFRLEGTPAQRVPPPRLGEGIDGLQAAWSAPTRAALAQAAGPAEWNAFALASPDLMQR